MIRTSRQLKDLIRNMAREKRAEAHILMRNYMMERLLERVSQSVYKDRLILKGGMLVAAMVGLDQRSTMDMDATIRGAELSVDAVENIVAEILSVPLEDGVAFRVKSITEIMEEAEYPGVRVSLESEFDGVRTPLKIDLSTGDAITPQEVSYRFRLMFEDREISILAYNLETVLAEKLETIITRDITNTRMRDFYDVFILMSSHATSLNAEDLHRALLATAEHRGTRALLPAAEAILTDIGQDETMRQLWSRYQRSFSYAADISWSMALGAVRRLWIMAN